MKKITVYNLLQSLGNDFDWEKEWQSLLYALNYANNTDYTGFIIGGNEYIINKSEQINLIEWHSALFMNVLIGVIEK